MIIMADSTKNMDVERIIDEQIRQMVQIAESREIRQKKQPTTLLDRLKLWWKKK